MVELLVRRVITARDDRNELAAVDSVSEHGRKECIELDLVASQPVERHTGLEFQVKIEQSLSCNRLQNHPAIFVGSDTIFLELFSFHWLSKHHLECVHALEHCRTMHPNQMEHSIERSLRGIALSMIPVNTKK